MALAGVKLDSDSGGFVSNCFPVRGLVKRGIFSEGDGAWLVAHRAEQRRRFKAVLCTKPRTYSRIREERKKAEEQGVRLTEQQFEEEDDGEKEEDVPTLDGYFLMKHCCVEDPADLCSINIAGQELSDVKEDDLDMFDNVAYINAGENYLPFEAFRGFPALRELEMPLNGLRSLKFANSDFPSLEVLDLSYNNLSQEDVLTLGQLPKLRVLHLTGNNFHNLPQDMSTPYVIGDRKVRRQRFARLEVLLLDDNKLADVSVFAALAGLPKLRHINMEKNEISHIPQLKCVEGRVITHSGSETKRNRPSSGHKSARHSKSRQKSDSLSERKDSHDLDEKLLGKKEPTEETVEKEGAGKTEEKEKPEGKGGGDGIEVQSAEEQANKEEDQALEALLVDDFSLGDLSARINELEEEAAEVIAAAEKKDKQESAPKEVEEVIPQVFPPFRELRYLNIAHNQVSEEDALLAVAAWPALVQLVIHNNPLTTQRTGDPPLLRRFLSDRLGIKLQRKDEPRLVKPHIEVSTGKSRKVSDRVPKVPRSTIEERLQQLALEGPKPPPALPEPSKSWLLEDRTLSGLDLETSKRMPLPPIPPTPPMAPTPRTQAWVERSRMEGEMKVMEEEGEETRAGGVRSDDSDAFFMTQVEDQEAEMIQKSKASKSPAQTKGPSGTQDDLNNSGEDRYHGYEALLDLDPDDDVDVDLPKDIQGNIRALKHVLGHQLVYRDPSVDLDHVKRVVPEFRRVPVPPPKPHKSRQARVDDLLDNLRTRTTVEEEALSKVLKDPRGMGKRFPEAQRLLGEIQRRYNKVRCDKKADFANENMWHSYPFCEPYLQAKEMGKTRKISFKTSLRPLRQATFK